MEKELHYFFFTFFTFCYFSRKKFKFFNFNYSNWISILYLFLLLNASSKKRFLTQTINQLSPKDNEKKYYIFSERHQSHYLTSFNMFKENLLFGSGPNSFRHLCDTEKYSVEKIIIENNTTRATADGKIIFNEENIFLTQLNFYRYLDTDVIIKASLSKNGEIFQTIIIPKRSKILIENNSNFKKVMLYS